MTGPFSWQAAGHTLVVEIQGTEKALRPGPSYRVGRDPQSDFVIDDIRVSWNHAVLRTESGAWFAEDCGSSNGTFVASRKIDRFEITDDCVLHFGHSPDIDMVERQVVVLERLTCASPGYLERHGKPTDPKALDGHRMVGLRSLTTGRLRPMEFMIDDKLHEVPLPATMSVNGTESYLAAALLGFGLVQMPRFHAGGPLADGTLVQVLPNYPPPSVPVTLLYPRNRQLSPRVRVFIDWMMRAFGRT